MLSNKDIININHWFRCAIHFLNQLNIHLLDLFDSSIVSKHIGTYLDLINISRWWKQLLRTLRLWAAALWSKGLHAWSRSTITSAEVRTADTAYNQHHSGAAGWTFWGTYDDLLNYYKPLRKYIMFQCRNVNVHPYSIVSMEFVTVFLKFAKN